MAVLMVKIANGSSLTYDGERSYHSWNGKMKHTKLQPEVIATK